MHHSTRHWSGIAQWSRVLMRAIIDFVPPSRRREPWNLIPLAKPSTSASITTRKPGLSLGLPVARSAGEGMPVRDGPAGCQTFSWIRRSIALED